MTDPAFPPLDGRPARRVPNCTLTEGDWLHAMSLFLEGASDAAVARRFAVSPSTVEAQLLLLGAAVSAGAPRPPGRTRWCGC